MADIFQEPKNLEFKTGLMTDGLDSVCAKYVRRRAMQPSGFIKEKRRLGSWAEGSCEPTFGSIRFDQDDMRRFRKRSAFHAVGSAAKFVHGL